MKKRNLTKQKICDVAIQLIETDGLEGLSMRKLAAKLNIEAASLYNHFKNKSQLFNFIQEHLYSQIPGDFTDQNWKKHLYELAIATRQSLLRVPNVILLFATRPTVTDSSLKQVESTLKILISAGFKKSEVLAIYRNIHVFVLGHILAEVGQVPGKDDGEEPSLNDINIDHYPVLKKISASKSNLDLEKGFKLGLDSIISGLEITLTRKGQ